MKQFLVGRKRDLSHHVSRGMRLSRRSYAPRKGLGEVLLMRALQRDLSMTKQAMAEKKAGAAIRRMRSFARANRDPMRNYDRSVRYRNRQLEELAARQGAEAYRMSRDALYNFGSAAVNALSGGVVPALQSAWRNRHNRNHDPNVVRVLYQ